MLFRSLLDGVKYAIPKGTEMSEVMKQTYEDVRAEHEAWKHENPEFAMIVEISAEILLTVLALAVLAVLLPWVIDALGFGGLGPRLGEQNLLVKSGKGDYADAN